MMCSWFKSNLAKRLFYFLKFPNFGIYFLLEGRAAFSPNTKKKEYVVVLKTHQF